MATDDDLRLCGPAVMAFHDDCLADRDGPGEPPRFERGLWRFVEINHRCNCLLWHEEDLARRTDVADAEIVANKRAIDRYNQARNDAVERIDETLVSGFAAVARAPDCRQNSETAGSIVDRLSILALKIRAMRAQATRADADGGHVARCAGMLAKLMEQRADLARCLDALLDDCAAGRACFKVYRQFKMYNDPALNPFQRQTGA